MSTVGDQKGPTHLPSTIRSLTEKILGKDATVTVYQDEDIWVVFTQRGQLLLKLDDLRLQAASGSLSLLLRCIGLVQRFLPDGDFSLEGLILFGEAFVLSNRGFNKRCCLVRKSDGKVKGKGKPFCFSIKNWLYSMLEAGSSSRRLYSQKCSRVLLKFIEIHGVVGCRI